MVRKKNKLFGRNNLIGYAFILPNFIGVLCFTILPVLFVFFLSLTEWDTSNSIEFVGIDNFTRAFTDTNFIISLKNTALYAVGTVPLTIVVSLGLALLLNKKIRGRNFFRTVFFFPYVASLIAAVVVWNMLFNPSVGPINSILHIIGISNPPKWCASTVWALPTVILFSVWKFSGYYLVMYLAALQGIPKELYEASSIDGASGIQRFKAITLPMLTPTTFFVAIMLTIQCFKVFDIVYAMTDGGPGRSTMVLVYYIYQKAFSDFQMGYASAMSVVLFAIVLIVTIIQFRSEKKWVSYM